MNIPTWSTLRGLGSNSAVRSASIWAVIVPISAKLLEHIEETTTISILGNTFRLHMSLPFSWKVLFLTAIAFMLANIVYALFCPPLIKETSAYRDFFEQKRSGAELAAAIDNLAKQGQLKRDMADNWLNWFSSRQVTLHQQTGAYSYEKEDRAFTEAYAIVIDALGKTNCVARFVAVFLYGLGLFALGYIMWQNSCFVIEHW
jgi:hypothetical protein